MVIIMSQSVLSRCMKTIIFGMWVFGAALYFAVVPMMGQELVEDYPEFSGRFVPWLVFIWCTALPAAAMLVLGWRVATNIGADKSFSAENAKLLEWISYLAAGDAGFFFVGNILFLLLSLSHPAVTLGSLFVSFIGVAIAAAAAVLSHLVQKASAIEEENDLTI